MPQRANPPSPEFELVLAAVRWPLETNDAARIQELAGGPVQWPKLLPLVEHHQVAPLVFHNLEACAAGSVPAEYLRALKAMAMENTRICFQAISEMVRLVHLFREHQIEVRVLKGAPLAITAFGDPALRATGDIDLLIRKGDLPKGDELLRSEGYLRGEPPAWPTPRRLRSYMAHQKDFSYENPRSGLVLDLHWRLLRNPRLPVNAGVEEAGIAWVPVGPEAIPTLPLDRLFLYLCVHGALDGWLRLKWLADIGALLRGLSPEEFRRIARQAAAQSALPELTAAALLCREKLACEGFPLDCLATRDPKVTRLLALANRLMASNGYCPVRESIPTTTWFLNEFSLAPAPISRLELVERSLFKPRVWQKLNLPDALFPLYALISPLEWLEFRVARLARWLFPRSRGRNADGKLGSGRSVFSRCLHLSFSDAMLLLEASFLLTFFRIALRLFPMQRLTPWMVHPPTRELSPAEDRKTEILRRIEWAIGAVVRHAPLAYVCFPQSLAAYFMLRRRHVQSRLFYGVAREKQQLKAHTWIKVGDRTITGGEAESQFTVLAIFP